MTRSGSTLRRVLLGSVLGVVALAAFAWTFGPRLMSGYARRVALQELESRGIDADIGGLALSATQAVITDLCIRGPEVEVDTPAVCLNVVRVRFERPGPFSLDIRPVEIRVDGGLVDLRAERGDLETQRAAWEAWLEPLLDRGDDEEEEREERDPNRERDEKRLDVRVRNLDVQMNGLGLPVEEVHLDDVGLTLTRGEVSLDVELELDGITIPGNLDIDVPEEWQLAAHQSDESPLTVSLMTEGLVRANAPAPMDGVQLAFSGVSVTLPWYVSLQDVQIDVPGQAEPLMRFPTATLEVQQWPTSLDDFYMTALDVASPEIFVALDDDGTPTMARALGLAPPMDDGTTEADEPADGGEVDEPSDEGDTEPTAEPGDAPADGEPTTDEPAAPDEDAEPLWADRIWWEMIPQQIRLHDATIATQRGDDPTRRVALTNASIQYALRIFHFQLDVSIDGDLRLGDDPAGDVDLVARWGWTRSRLRLDTALRDVDLALVGALTGRAPSPITGRTDLDLRFYEAPRGPGLQSDGRLEVRGLAADLTGSDGTGLLSGPVEVGNIVWEWDASRSRDEEPVAFRWHQSDFTVGDVTASIAPTFYDFEYDDPPFFSRVEIAVEVPLQSAQALFDAVPRVLVGPLAGTEMAGDWGLRVTFPVAWVDREDGTRGIEIGAPTEYAVLEDGLELLSLPNSVDVRRLNRAFEFTFRGPDDAINRTLRVPAPRNPDEPLPVVEGDEDDLLEDLVPERGPEVNGVPWARLHDMNYYLIATQLYREDGRFFTNHGINWYQLRRALEEAWDAGRLTRGASTITMQTVKNVFLSHERSLERKLQELFLTAWMTRLVPKERILEVYLNVIEWGPGVNGIVEAADHYFGTTPAELSFAEAVWLSAITPAPQRRAPQREMGSPPDWSMRLVHDLMRGMEGRELVTAEELAKGLEQEILFVTHPRWGEESPVLTRHLLPEGLLDGVDTADPGALLEPAPVAPGPPQDRGPFLSMPPRDRIGALIERSIPLARTP